MIATTCGLLSVLRCSVRWGYTCSAKSPSVRSRHDNLYRRTKPRPRHCPARQYHPAVQPMSPAMLHPRAKSPIDVIVGWPAVVSQRIDCRYQSAQRYVDGRLEGISGSRSAGRSGCRTGRTVDVTLVVPGVDAWGQNTASVYSLLLGDQPVETCRLAACRYKYTPDHCCCRRGVVQAEHLWGWHYWWFRAGEGLQNGARYAAATVVSSR